MWLSKPLMQFIQPDFPVWMALVLLAAVALVGLGIGQLIWK